jgi:hypothetical protein
MIIQIMNINFKPINGSQQITNTIRKIKNSYINKIDKVDYLM